VKVTVYAASLPATKEKQSLHDTIISFLLYEAVLLTHAQMKLAYGENAPPLNHFFWPSTVFIVLHMKMRERKIVLSFFSTTGSEGILFKGGNDIIPNRRYDEFYTE